MNFMGKFIATLIIIDTFLVSYAVGFNSRNVLIEDLAIKAPPPAPVKKIDAVSAKSAVSSRSAIPSKSAVPSKSAKSGAAAKDTAHPAKAGPHVIKHKAKTNGTIKTTGPDKKAAASQKKEP